MLQFRDNLTARLQLLAQLHMKLPEDLNAAEQQLRDSDLPELDQQTQLLKKQIQVTAALQSYDLPAHVVVSPNQPLFKRSYHG